MEIAPRLHPNSFTSTGRNTPNPACEFHTPNMTSEQAPTTTQPCRRGMSDMRPR